MKFKVGDKVVIDVPYPRYGLGEVSEDEVGIIEHIEDDDPVIYLINFPTHMKKAGRLWHGIESDLAHVQPTNNEEGLFLLRSDEI